VMHYNLAGNPGKYASIAGLLGRTSNGRSILATAEHAVEAVFELQEALDVSSCLADYRSPEDDLPVLVSGAMKQARLFIPNPRDLDETAVELIYRQAFLRRGK